MHQAPIFARYPLRPRPRAEPTPAPPPCRMIQPADWRGRTDAERGGTFPAPADAAVDEAEFPPAVAAIKSPAMMSRRPRRTSRLQVGDGLARFRRRGGLGPPARATRPRRNGHAQTSWPFRAASASGRSHTSCRRGDTRQLDRSPPDARHLGARRPSRRQGAGGPSEDELGRTAESEGPSPRRRGRPCPDRRPLPPYDVGGSTRGAGAVSSNGRLPARGRGRGRARTRGPREAAPWTAA